MNLPPLTTTHVIFENWSLDHKNGDQLLYHQTTSLFLTIQLCAFYLTYLIQNITQNIIFNTWYLINILSKSQDLKFNLKVFSIMYTTVCFFFQKCEINWKENYLNFVIEYHFNDHSLENLIQAHDLWIEKNFVDNI